MASTSSSSGPPAAAAPELRESDGKVFVGGVPVGTPEGELRDHFAAFGEVAAVAVPRHRRTGKPRGYAFVQFVRGEDAGRAVAAGRERHVVNGGMLDVKEADPLRMEKILSSERASQHHLPDDPTVNRKIFVGGLPPSVDDTQLRGHFERFGAVARAIVVTDQDTHVSRGFGFVEFFSGESAKRATEEERHCVGTAWVEVKEAATSSSAAAAKGGGDDDDGSDDDRRMLHAAAGSCSGLSVHAPPYYPADNVRYVAGGYFVPGVFICHDDRPPAAAGVAFRRSASN